MEDMKNKKTCSLCAWECWDNLKSTKEATKTGPSRTPRSSEFMQVNCVQSTFLKERYGEKWRRAPPSNNADQMETM
eukprot:scaffold306666_cov14-Tisochrysis_lutea.AAC.1